MAQAGARAESARNPLSLSDLDTSTDEPRILDVRVGERLGMAQPLNIRKTIEVNADELRRYGPIHAAREKVSLGSGAVREVTAYHLNEAQTLLLCMLSRTARAADVRQEVIAVFLAWRRGVAPPAADLADLRARVARLEAREDRLLGIIERLAERPALAVVPAAAPVAGPALAPSRADYEDRLGRRLTAAYPPRPESAQAPARQQAEAMGARLDAQRGDEAAIGRFLAAVTGTDTAGVGVVAADLYAAYSAWRRPHGPVASLTAFGRRLAGLGLRKRKVGGRIVYVDLRLMGEAHGHA